MKRKCHYNPVFNFNNFLDNILGNNPLKKLGKDNSEKVISELRQKIKEYNWLPESLTIYDLRLLLHIIGRRDLCKFSTLILRVISGESLLPLTSVQKAQIEYIYSRIRNYLPKRMNNSFLIYKILDLILPKGPQRELLSYIKLQSAATNKKNEWLWSSAIQAAGIVR